MPRALVPLLAITFVDVLGFTILIPILPFYAEHFGASPTTVGAIYATLAVCSLLSSPFWGRLSDRIGRKGVLIAAQVAGLLGFSLLAAGTRALDDLRRARDRGARRRRARRHAGVRDRRDHARRSARGRSAWSARRSALAFLIGPALAALLVRFGYAVPFWVAAGLAALTIVLTMVLLPESKGAVKTAPTLARGSRVAGLGGARAADPHAVRVRASRSRRG